MNKYYYLLIKAGSEVKASRGHRKCSHTQPDVKEREDRLSFL
jgi:hypothetical protein